MKPSRVTVLYNNGLFGKGIAALLARDPDLEVTLRRQSGDPVAPAEIPSAEDVDALVVEASDDFRAVDLLARSLPQVPITVVSLATNRLETFRNGERVRCDASGGVSALLCQLTGSSHS